MKVATEEELGEALKSEENTIEIEGDLAKKIIKIRATGKVAWAIAIAAIGVAVYAAIATVGTGGAAAPAGLVAEFAIAPVAVGILGATTTWSAILIAVAAGGIGVLTNLRSYKEISRSSKSLVLQRK